MQRNSNNCVNFNLQYFVQNLESYMSVDVKKSVSERTKTVAAGLTEQANGQLCGNTYRRVCCKLKKRTKLILSNFSLRLIYILNTSGVCHRVLQNPWMEYWDCLLLGC